MKKEDSIDNFTSLQTLGTPSYVASNRPSGQGATSCADPTHARVTPFWSFELLQDFLRRKQLHSSLLLSNTKDVDMRTSCCASRQRQGHTSGVTTSTELGAAGRLLSYHQPPKFVLWPRDTPKGHTAQAAQSRTAQAGAHSG